MALYYVPSGVSSTTEIKISARQPRPIPCFRLVNKLKLFDFIHKLIQDKQSAKSSDTATICTRQLHNNRLGYLGVPRDRSRRPSAGASRRVVFIYQVFEIDIESHFQSALVVITPKPVNVITKGILTRKVGYAVKYEPCAIRPYRMPAYRSANTAVDKQLNEDET